MKTEKTKFILKNTKLKPCKNQIIKVISARDTCIKDIDIYKEKIDNLDLEIKKHQSMELDDVKANVNLLHPKIYDIIDKGDRILKNLLGVLKFSLFKIHEELK